MGSNPTWEPEPKPKGDGSFRLEPWRTRDTKWDETERRQRRWKHAGRRCMVGCNGSVEEVHDGRADPGQHAPFLKG